MEVEWSIFQGYIPMKLGDIQKPFIFLVVFGQVSSWQQVLYTIEHWFALA